MQKRIAIIIERADTALGGAERSIFELATALSGTGLEVDIIAAKGRTNTKNIHILCQDLPGKRVSYSVFERAVRKHLSERLYNLIHSVLPFDFADIYQPRGGAYAESVLRNAASYQNKLIESYKKLTAFANFRRSELLRAEGKLCRKPDGPVIAALSQYVAEQFKRHYSVRDDRIVIIPNGVKINRQVDTKEAERFRTRMLSRLGLKEADNAVFFLFAANNFRLKGLSAAIKALMYAKEKYSMGHQACLVVVGSGRAGKYARLAKKLGVDNRIIFLGVVHHLRNVLSVIDVAVLPTFYDPSSRYILEALAAGKPVITTRFNGAVDLFVDGRHGKVIDSPEDTGALAEAISYFTEAGNIQKASEAIIADKLGEEISISRVARQIDGLYESILQKKGRK